MSFNSQKIKRYYELTDIEIAEQVLLNEIPSFYIDHETLVQSLPVVVWLRMYGFINDSNIVLRNFRLRYLRYDCDLIDCTVHFRTGATLEDYIYEP